MEQSYVMLPPDEERYILDQPKIDEEAAHQMSIVNLMTVVIDRVERSRLSPVFLEHNKAVLHELASRLNVSVFQSIIISIIMDNEHSVSLQTIARHIGCSTLIIKSRHKEVEDLIDRHILCADGDYTRPNYSMTEDAISSFLDNHEYLYEVPFCLSPEIFFYHLTRILLSYSAYCGDDDYKPLWIKFEELMRHNTHFLFVQRILNANEISIFGRIVLLLLADTLVRLHKTHLTKDLLETVMAFNSHLCFEEEKELNILINKGLIEYECAAGFEDDGKYCLSLHSCDIYFSDLKLSSSLNRYYAADTIDPSKLTKKQLFYNADDAAQVRQLTDLLKEVNFSKICTRLEQDGFRKGFACLFFGAPGVGKTETVYQLAKSTDRKIISVNVNDILSKWVGDSEKRIKSVFSSYRERIKHLDKAPILLFNECDGILHRRIEYVENSVDQMSNSIQNIILQEMESFEGIMICTTNLTKNLDKAFDRRFLYKIEFHRPDSSTQSHIWASMVSELSENDANALANEFDFSGGEIENCVRKMKVNHLLAGSEINYTAIRDICSHEIIDTVESSRKIIGF